jgi:hypothetical protein
MKRIAGLTILGCFPILAMAAEFDGTWTATFETQVGEQNYTYTFTVDGMEVTGTAVSANGEVEITAGKIEGDTISFVENLNYQGMELVITYTGKMTSDDEIEFSRQVADVATEELVAKRKM